MALKISGHLWLDQANSAERSDTEKNTYLTHCPYQQEAVEYYTKLEESLLKIFMEEREKVQKKHLKMIFVTFQNEVVAER